MQLCVFQVDTDETHVGLVEDDRVYDLTSSGQPQLRSMTALLQASVTTPIDQIVGAVNVADLPSYAYADLERQPSADAPSLRAPVDRQEVWAAGVTYAWSREARVREAVSKDIYVRVYEAERPELFFKSLAEKVVGPHDWVGLRSDSHWNVPEPELALVINPALQVVGYTVGNDVSSRDIEGENPLYLPQAKVFTHACALGPVITVADETVDARHMTIHLSISRDGAEVYTGDTSTDKMQRAPEDLAAYLGHSNEFPYGAVLLTGTGIVPGDDFTLQDGDQVAITIDGIGTLHNVVRQISAEARSR